MVFLYGWFNGDEFHAHLVGALCQLTQDPFAVSFFVVILSLVGVLLAFGQHRVDQPRQFMSGGCHGLGFVHA